MFFKRNHLSVRSNLSKLKLKTKLAEKGKKKKDQLGLAEILGRKQAPQDPWKISKQRKEKWPLIFGVVSSKFMPPRCSPWRSYVPIAREWLRKGWKMNHYWQRNYPHCSEKTQEWTSLPLQPGTVLLGYGAWNLAVGWFEDQSHQRSKAGACLPPKACPDSASCHMKW